MSKHFFTSSRTSTIRLFLTVSLGVCLVLAALWSFRHSASHIAVPATKGLPSEEGNEKEEWRESSRQKGAPRQLAGADARKYLQQSGDGHSLMQAITTARFGLKSQERGPFGEKGAGYLGLSHNQNLNAWFAEDGVTVRPTVTEEERERAWHVDMRLKAYGYGNDLVAAPPIVSHQVNGNRIEYERAADFALRNPNLPIGALPALELASGNRQAAVTEWYENRAEGIEQGFTLAARPARKDTVAPDEPLRLVVSLKGDLRAQVKDKGRAIELTDASGKGGVSYSKLTALDANGKQLAAHMEASADGSEIVLLVDDRSASYPLVIDPIVATLVKIVDAGALREVGAGFGDAVAVDDIRLNGTDDIGFAVVGAWLEDTGGLDNGVVYFFTRTASAWDLNGQFFLASTTQTGERCGYSVAVNNLVDGGPFTPLFEEAAFGCPGANSNTGKAFRWSYPARSATELVPASGTRNVGDYFGASVALSLNYAVVGAPLHDIPGISDAGAIHIFSLSSVVNGNHSYFGPAIANARLGSGVAIEGNGIAAGIPGEGLGRVDIYTKDSNNDWNPLANKLAASNGQAGDLFGESLALSNNTLVISAAADHDRGTGAGAAYVFVRGANGQWSQQQKLTASDGRADDIFSYYAVAIEGNTIVVGARRNDGVSSNPNDNRGAAYIFTRNGGVWTQDTKLGPAAFFGAPGNEFGSSVSISGATAIVSAPHGTAPSDGTPNSGVVYAYGLSCSPAYHSAAKFYPTTVGVSQLTLCPGDSALLQVTYLGGSGDPLRFQWRKDGISIPGATSTVYRIPSVSGSDGGSYDVSVSNSCGGEISSPATLIVHSFNISPSSQNLGVSGSTGVISVTLTGNCTLSAWTAVSNSPFITVTSGASGMGNGTVGFTVAANPNPTQRTGTITAAGRTFTVAQDGTSGVSSSIQFSASNFSASEGAVSATVIVTRTGATSGSASVDVATVDDLAAVRCDAINGTAYARCDYATSVDTLTFAPGETAKTFTIPLIDDVFVEGNETVQLRLTSPTGATLGGQNLSTVTITDNDAGGASNPIFNSSFFVRLQYLDFLSREPDVAGFNAWLGVLNNCSDLNNFGSQEFQLKGFFVYRLYKLAFNRLPAYGELIPDMRAVTGQTSAEVFLKKAAFTNAFAQRGEFTSGYGALTNGQYVTTLMGRYSISQITTPDPAAPDGASRVTLTNADLSNRLNASTLTRAQVLRAIADSDQVFTAEFNQAFVAMQYYGYLRRAPDLAGYNSWLTYLNSHPSDSRTMVNGFMNSVEYHLRFGPP
jgi:hypothetical protein